MSEILQCISCEKEFSSTHIKKCKEYEICEGIFCSLCATTCLDEKEFCESCRVTWCIECSTEIQRDDGIMCVTCDVVFCDICAQFMLDESNYCPEHSSLETVACAYCKKILFLNNTMSCETCMRMYCGECFPERITRCEECGAQYCLLCKGKDHFDTRGRCPRVKKISNLFRGLRAIFGT